MASQRGICLIQDQNLNLRFSAGPGSVGGNANGSKVHKRGPAGGRKPFGDLSNAGKQPSVNQTFKKSSSKGLSIIQEGTIVNSSKIRSNATRKRSITKTTDRAQSTSRKALTDISNTGESCAPQALKRNTSNNLRVLAEDSIPADAITEEQFHHNHEDCAMDKDCFLETLGLDKGLQNGLTKQLPMKYCFQYEEMVDMAIANQSPLGSSGLDSPNPCQTPSQEQYSRWKKDLECVNFILTVTPKPLKN
ncbi:hypothetical protein SAY87_001227 [Trapa incisa]|uniref:Uncharacterized protein n=1 Tax=Trapa incisa TaxID=236973 RepID=A0AAN7JAB3_9MYRT|nr:hypothetical protein SAY87_001227 [Trapa incisa]